MEQTVSGRSIAETFLSSLSSAEHVREPYDYWLLEKMLPQTTLKQLQALPFEAPKGAAFSGRRETNNATRVYFTREAQAEFPVVRDMADAFGNAETVRAIEKATGTDLSAGRLRIEYCIDTDGFWLEPHTDISVKLFTMLVYLSEDPALRDAGTDVYDATPEHNLVVSAPYAANAGLIFIPGKDTWHGFGKRPINGVRTSLIINFVTPEWRDTWELC
jgi:hypothetical protein